MPVLAEGRVVRHRRPERQATEPAIGKVIPHLLAKPPLGRDGVDATDQRHADQQLRVDRWPPAWAVMTGERVTQIAHVEQPIHPPQQMLARQQAIDRARPRPATASPIQLAHHCRSPGSLHRERNARGARAGLFQQPRPVVTPAAYLKSTDDREWCSLPECHRRSGRQRSGKCWRANEACRAFVFGLSLVITQTGI
jgi:hypothetical protein